MIIQCKDCGKDVERFPAYDPITHKPTCYDCFRNACDSCENIRRQTGNKCWLCGNIINIGNGVCSNCGTP